MNDIQAWLYQGKTLADQATEGPWIAEFSRETGDCVIPHDAQSTREAVATTRLLHAPADAAFIADARTRLPAALDALQAVHDMHRRIWVDGIEYCKHCVDFGGEYPCPTRRALRAAIEGMGA